MNFTRPKLLLSLLLLAVVGLLATGNVLAQDPSVTAINVRPNAQSGHYPILLDNGQGLNSVDVVLTNLEATAATGDLNVNLSISWPGQIGGPLVLTQSFTNYTFDAAATQTVTFTGAWLKTNLFAFDRRIIYTIDASFTFTGTDNVGGNNVVLGRKIAPAFNKAKITVDYRAGSTADFDNLSFMGEYLTYSGLLGDLEVSITSGTFSSSHTEPSSSTMSIDGQYFSSDDNFEIYIHGLKNYPQSTIIRDIARRRDLSEPWLWKFNQMNVDIKYITFTLEPTALYNEGGQILNYGNTSNDFYSLDVEGNVFNGYLVPELSSHTFTDIYCDGDYMSYLRLHNNTFNGGYASVYVGPDANPSPVGTAINVTNNTVNNFTNYGFVMVRPAVTSPADYDGGLFTGNSFTTAAFTNGSAISVTNLSVIENNTFNLFGSAMNAYGIEIIHSPSYYPEVRINNNTFTGFGYGAIYSMNARKATITYNTINIDNSLDMAAILINGGGSDIFTNYTLIEKNNITMTTEGNGIFIAQGYHKVYYNNIYVESAASINANYAISADNSIGIIATNLIQTEFADGIVVAGNDENIFYNTIVVNGIGNTDDALLIGEVGAGLGKTTAKRNMLYNISNNASAYGIYVTPGLTAPIVLDENNYWSVGGNLGEFTGVAADITTWQGFTQALVATNDIGSTEAPPAWITREESQVFTYAFFDDNTDSTDVGVYDGIFFDEPLFGNDDPLHTELELFDFFGTQRIGYYAGYTNVHPVVSVVTQPADIFSCKGEDWQLQAVADVTLNVHAYYQWMKDGVVIDGASEATLNLDSLNWNHAGKYQCIISGQGGTAPVMSDEVIVVVVGKTSITRQPVDQVGQEHGNVVFEVEAHTQGFPPYDPDFPSEIYNPKFQWYTIDNGVGVPLEDGSDYDYNVIAGAKSSILTINNLNTDAWTEPIKVYCEILGYCDFELDILSNKVWEWTRSSTVQVLAPPTMVVATQPVSTTACEGKEAIFKVEVTITGDAVASYQWKKDGVELNGQNANELKINPVKLTDAGVYSVDITFLDVVTTSESATLTVDPIPTITTISDDINVQVGQPIDIVVDASGPGTLTYQWQHDGADVGTNSATFSIAAAQTSDAGPYTCLVTNNCGTIESEIVNVVVTIKEVPSNVDDAVAGGFVLMTNVPNPFTEATTISFVSPIATNVRLSITDVFGREVASFNSIASEGLNTIDVNASTARLTSGAYNYTLEANGIKLTKQMIINR